MAADHNKLVLETLLELKESQGRLEHKIDATYEQAKATNGRVNEHDKRIQAIEGTHSKVKFLATAISVAIGAGWAVVTTFFKGQ